MAFVAFGVFVLGCVVGWFVHLATLADLEIVFHDGTYVEGYIKKKHLKKDAEDKNE